MDLSTLSINRWMHDTIDLLYPLYFCQMNKVMESSVLHIDETTIPINDKPGKTRKGYISVSYTHLTLPTIRLV